MVFNVRILQNGEPIDSSKLENVIISCPGIDKIINNATYRLNDEGQLSVV